MKKSLKRRIELFLVGFPYGLYGKVCNVENNGIGKYTLWDKLRYRLLVGKSMKEMERKNDYRAIQGGRNYLH